MRIAKKFFFDARRFLFSSPEQVEPTKNPYAIDFDISMGKGSYYYDQCIKAKKGVYTYATYPRPASDLLDFFRSLYEKNKISNITPSSSLKIPPISHILWAGDKFPEQFHKFRQSWIDHHPEWTHIFWVDSEINYTFGKVIEYSKTFAQDLLQGNFTGQSIVVDIRKLNLYNQHFYDQATNFGEKTDILKYEIVYMFGGVYIDVDFESLKPLDILHQYYDFYVGIQPLDESLALGAALFGATPHHPILKHCIETIKDDRDKKDPVQRTGPGHFTRSFWASAQESPGITIALPATYFYPIGIRQKTLSRKKIELFIKPETFALHHWAGSWIDIF